MNKYPIILEIHDPPKPKPERTCGSCRLCCKLLSVNEEGHKPNSNMEYEFHKPAFKWCKKACDKGCSIYGTEDFPWTCRTFSCAWLEGMGDESLKPNKCGMVVSLEGDDKGKMLAVVWEDRPGLHISPLGKKLEQVLWNNSDTSAICVVNGTKTLRLVFERGQKGDLPKFCVPLDEQFTQEDLTANVDREREFSMEVLGAEPDSFPSSGYKEVLAEALAKLGKEKSKELIEKYGMQNRFALVE
jgi:hypothetical protein